MEYDLLLLLWVTTSTATLPHSGVYNVTPSIPDRDTSGIDAATFSIPDPEIEPACDESVLAPDPDNCRTYFECVDGEPRKRTCPGIDEFSPVYLWCLPPKLARCRPIPIPTPSPCNQTESTTPTLTTTPSPTTDITEPTTEDTNTSSTKDIIKLISTRKEDITSKYTETHSKEHITSTKSKYFTNKIVPGFFHETTERPFSGVDGSNTEKLDNADEINGVFTTTSVPDDLSTETSLGSKMTAEISEIATPQVNFETTTMKYEDDNTTILDNTTTEVEDNKTAAALIDAKISTTTDDKGISKKTTPKKEGSDEPPTLRDMEDSDRPLTPEDEMNTHKYLGKDVTTTSMAPEKGILTSTTKNINKHTTAEDYQDITTIPYFEGQAAILKVEDKTKSSEESNLTKPSEPTTKIPVIDGETATTKITESTVDDESKTDQLPDDQIKTSKGPSDGVITTKPPTVDKNEPSSTLSDINITPKDSDYNTITNTTEEDETNTKRSNANNMTVTQDLTDNEITTKRPVDDGTIISSVPKVSKTTTKVALHDNKTTEEQKADDNTTKETSSKPVQDNIEEITITKLLLDITTGSDETEKTSSTNESDIDKTIKTYPQGQAMIATPKNETDITTNKRPKDTHKITTMKPADDTEPTKLPLEDKTSDTEKLTDGDEITKQPIDSETNTIDKTSVTKDPTYETSTPKDTTEKTLTSKDVTYDTALPTNEENNVSTPQDIVNEITTNKVTTDSEYTTKFQFLTTPTSINDRITRPEGKILSSKASIGDKITTTKDAEDRITTSKDDKDHASTLKPVGHIEDTINNEKATTLEYAEDETITPKDEVDVTKTTKFSTDSDKTASTKDIDEKITTDENTLTPEDVNKITTYSDVLTTIKVQIDQNGTTKTPADNDTTITTKVPKDRERTTQLPETTTSQLSTDDKTRTTELPTDDDSTETSKVPIDSVTTNKHDNLTTAKPDTYTRPHPESLDLTTTEKTTDFDSSRVNAQIMCVELQRYPYADNCMKYYKCVGGRLVEKECPNRTEFSVDYAYCLPPFLARCNKSIDYDWNSKNYTFPECLLYPLTTVTPRVTTKFPDSQGQILNDKIDNGSTTFEVNDETTTILEITTPEEEFETTAPKVYDETTTSKVDDKITTSADGEITSKQLADGVSTESSKGIEKITLDDDNITPKPTTDLVTTPVDEEKTTVTPAIFHENNKTTTSYEVDDRTTTAKRDDKTTISQENDKTTTGRSTKLNGGQAAIFTTATLKIKDKSIDMPNEASSSPSTMPKVDDETATARTDDAKTQAYDDPTAIYKGELTTKPEENTTTSTNEPTTYDVKDEKTTPESYLTTTTPKTEGNNYNYIALNQSETNPENSGFLLASEQNHSKSNNSHGEISENNYHKIIYQIPATKRPLKSRKIGPSLIQTYLCADTDIYPDPNDCRRYHKCENGMIEHKTCEDSKEFSPRYLVCLPPPMAQCSTEYSVKPLFETKARSKKTKPTNILPIFEPQGSAMFYEPPKVNIAESSTQKVIVWKVTSKAEYGSSTQRVISVQAPSESIEINLQGYPNSEKHFEPVRIVPEEPEYDSSTPKVIMAQAPLEPIELQIQGSPSQKDPDLPKIEVQEIILATTPHTRTTPHPTRIPPKKAAVTPCSVCNQHRNFQAQNYPKNYYQQWALPQYGQQYPWGGR